MKQATFYLANMCCSSEESLVRKHLSAMAGVSELRFQMVDRRLTVQHELMDEQPIFQALQKLGMGPHQEALSGPAKPGFSRGGAALGVAGFLAVVCEVLAFRGVAETSGLVVGPALLSMLLSGRETFSRGWAALRSWSFNMNFLMTTAIVGAVWIGEWPEAAMVTFLFSLAERVEKYSLDRARHAIRSLMELSPEKATVLSCCGHESQVPAAQVALGKRVRVKPGERVPLDGTVVAGASSVNQAPITGESLPVEKRAGDVVFAGTINERGSFDFQVTAIRGNTTLDRIVAAVQAAQEERAPTQRFVDRFARVYTPAVMGLALLVALVPPWLWGAPFALWAYRALALLVVACPCALVISTPVTVVSGLAAAARAGILIKGGVYLEEGRRLRVIALDKTGTLTRGQPEVTEVMAQEGFSEEEVLALLASLESRSEHPLAGAILRRWGKRPLLEVTDFEALPGRGLRGEIGGQVYRAGNARLVRESGRSAPDGAELEAAGKTLIFLMNDREVLGALAVADPIRESSRKAVARLKSLGIHPLMLSGDDQKTAEAIAARLGIEEVRGNLLPEEKLQALQQAQQRLGPVGMVGDGINDAPALAWASVGFAMGAAGTATALETADVALMQDDLRGLPEFLVLSRQTGRLLAQNIGFSLLVKLLALGLSLSGHLTLWMAVLADVGATLLVVANGLRLLRFRPQSE